MQTIIALPSIAASRCSKWSTRSSATSSIRFSAPTSASSRAHLLLSFSLLVQLLALGDLLEVLVDLRPLGLVEFDLGQPALVVDPDGGPVLDGPLDVVDVDVVAEDGLGVLVGRLDGRAGEPDERGVGQGVSHVPGEAVDEVVLAAVGLVGDDDDVAAVGQQRDSLSPFVSGRNFWIVVKTTPPEATLSSSSHLVPVLGLGRLLPQQLLAGGERAEELVVEVVAVGEDDECRVGHRRVRDDLAGVEGHRQALAAALGVPDDADPLVTLGRGGPTVQSTALLTAWYWW